jgi:hypothetical protein
MRIFPTKRFWVETPFVPNNEREARKEMAVVRDQRWSNPGAHLPARYSRPYTYADAIATAEWLNEAHEDRRIK